MRGFCTASEVIVRTSGAVGIARIAGGDGGVTGKDGLGGSATTSSVFGGT